MTLKEVTIGISEVIAQNSRFTYREIQEDKPLERYISSDMKARLAREVKRRFSKVKTTKLTNDLYVSIKKVKDLAKYVYEIYKTI